MSDHQHTVPVESTPLTKDEQKQLLLDAIQKRFPDTNFREWPYYRLGHLLNWDGGGGTPFMFIEFLTNLLTYIAERKLTDSFLEQVDSNGFDLVKKLIRFFSFISDSEEHYAFVRYFMFKSVGCDEQEIVNAARDYLTGSDLQRVLDANLDAI